MIKAVCVHHCPSAFCVLACPSGALMVKDGNVVVEHDLCHGCGLCRYSCMTWSRDHVMRTKSKFWLAGRM